MKIESGIILALEEIGNPVSEYHKESLLEEYIEDSLSFVSFIIYIEENFDIVFPVKALNSNLYKTTMRELEVILEEAVIKKLNKLEK